MSKTNKATQHPISFMLGKGTSFDTREMQTSVQSAVPINRQWSPSTALVRAEPLGMRVTRISDLRDLLQWACRQLAMDNTNLLHLENLLKQPALPAQIAKIIYPNDHVPADTTIPIITFAEFQTGVRKVVENIDPLASSIAGIPELIVYTYGRAAVEQGFVIASREMIDVTLTGDLIPDYPEIKSAGLATLLEHVLEGTKASFTMLGSKKILPKLMFDTLRTTLMLLSEKLIEMRFQWESFDALAAVTVAKLTGYFDTDPTRVAFIKNAEVEAFSRNFTLVSAAMNHFVGQRAIQQKIPTLVDAEAYAYNFRGMVAAITTSPLLKQVPLEAFIERTNITRLFSSNKLLLALLMEPAFVATPSAQVSYVANTDTTQGTVLTPMAEIEAHLTGLYRPLAKLASASIIDLHNVIVNAIIDDGESLAAEAGATMQLSVGAGTTAIPGYLYVPELLTKNMSNEYVQHVGAAFSSYLGLADLSDGLEAPHISFFFSATSPDLHYMTTPIDAGLAVTDDPALVIALRGDPITAQHRSTASWDLGPQLLDDEARRALLMNVHASTSALFPDYRNSLDKANQITLQLSKTVKEVMKVPSLATELSVYELLGGPKFPGDINVVQTHFNPIFSAQVESALSLLVSLYERAANERGEHATVAAAVTLLQPLIQGREFQIIYRGVLARLAHEAATPAQRLFLSRSFKNTFDMLELQVSLILLILLRCRLISFEAYQIYSKAKLFTSPSFRIALATSGVSL